MKEMHASILKARNDPEHHSVERIVGGGHSCFPLYHHLAFSYYSMNPLTFLSHFCSFSFRNHTIGQLSRLQSLITYLFFLISPSHFVNCHDRLILQITLTKMAG